MRLSGTKATAIHQYRGLGNQLWDLAGNRPSLDLRFADDKSLADAVTGTNLVDHTRASSGTYVGSDGLIKTATTNLLLRSEEFDSTWAVSTSGGTATITPDVALAPDGQNTADRFESSGGSNGIQQVLTLGLLPYTYSLYVKQAGADSSALVRLSVGPFYFSFDLVNGTFFDVDASFSPPAATQVENGWWRISGTRTTTATANAIRIFSVLGSSADVYIWGAQLEQSSTVGEYIPTTSTINSAPRFNHDPTTGESLGLMGEESRTNLMNDSSTSSMTTLHVTAGTTAAQLNPEGVASCRRITANSGLSANGVRIAKGATTSANNTTVSAFVKKDTHRYVYIGFGGGANSYTALFDIEPGLAGTRLLGQAGIGTYTNINAGYEDYPNGWIRIWASGTTTGTDGPTIGLSPNAATYGITNWSPTGTEAIFVHGIQYEDNATFPTSYIPTAGSAVTRAADVAGISESNFSSWYRQDAGTVRVEWHNTVEKQWSLYASFFAVRNPGSTEYIGYGATNGGNGYQVYWTAKTGNIIQLDYAAYSPGFPNVVEASWTHAIALTTNDAAFYEGGFQRKIDNSITMPSPTEAVFDTTNTCLKRVTFWPARLPNETLKQITQ